MPIYRAVARTSFDPEREHVPYPGQRLPGNLPYFVDNLWEFTRPEDKPSRRHAVYASPTPELALDGASGPRRPRESFIACEVVPRAPLRTFQLSVADARAHPDLPVLRDAVHEKIAAATLDEKLAFAPLFVPGMTRAELAAAMDRSAALRVFVTALAARVSVWSDMPDTAKGELFFEIEEGNSYTLHPVQA